MARFRIKVYFLLLLSVGGGAKIEVVAKLGKIDAVKVQIEVEAEFFKLYVVIV